MTALDQKIKTMRAWVQRREDLHKGWTQDQLWNRIKENWPTLPEQDMEVIFQAAHARK